MKKERKSSHTLIMNRVCRFSIFLKLPYLKPGQHDLHWPWGNERASFCLTGRERVSILKSNKTNLNNSNIRFLHQNKRSMENMIVWKCFWSMHHELIMIFCICFMNPYNFAISVRFLKVWAWLQFSLWESLNFVKDEKIFALN